MKSGKQIPDGVTIGKFRDLLFPLATLVRLTGFACHCTVTPSVNEHVITLHYSPPLRITNLLYCNCAALPYSFQSPIQKYAQLTIWTLPIHIAGCAYCSEKSSQNVAEMIIAKELKKFSPRFHAGVGQQTAQPVAYRLLSQIQTFRQFFHRAARELSG